MRSRAKLNFKISFDSEETRSALYSESSMRGNALVLPNDTGEESKPDLELLYKAIIMNQSGVLRVFNAHSK